MATKWYHRGFITRPQWDGEGCWYGWAEGFDYHPFFYFGRSKEVAEASFKYEVDRYLDWCTAVKTQPAVPESIRLGKHGS